MYLEKGNSFRQMAKLAGVHETIIARRIHKITKRLLYGEYITCLRNSKRFSAIELSIAREYFLTGLSMREIARKRQITYYQVRKVLRKIRQVNSVNRQLE
jgi:transposase